MKNSPFKAHVDKVQPMEQGKWIQTRKIDYTDPDGKSRVWEMAVRTTRTETTGLDAVSILGLLQKPGSKGKHVVLTKQFRPPVGKVVVELPAGLIDPNESVATTAERELLEETGYHGKVTKESIPLYSDPGLTNANMALATVDIDMADPRNTDPQPQLEDGEYIEVFTLPMAGLYDGLLAVCEKEGTTVDARLFHLAEGLRLADALQ
ncbi:hypothetical protein METBIDRAFT_44333 [Metschnikowia bicuspidata var. bicuspidata NRRL YB-4993]|uniref:Nudix hydrolase domain-containing protein n=1 Tax=Metschnikowia bicuspidata var. bicuspidata NRRL YB-4993 TaxID=869754 RepID=A0A1A0H950_9ASCO|nr:hypothetical protein METBIDRAFT_44333 [Metschnikowia bicuspidata var. bicuspidata NRRL YB-4993]OBA20407.1 hypothetical protein METBIDRAFT_44333 [Metschnikowia bicuspidata var. bicuspidata NRRL YB-4993]